MAPAPRYRKHVRNQSHLSVQSMGIIPQLLFERGGEEKLNSSGCFCPVWRVPGWHLMASVALLTVPSSYWYVVIRSVGEITWDVLLAGDWGRIFAACCTCLWYTVFPFYQWPYYTYTMFIRGCCHCISMRNHNTVPLIRISLQLPRNPLHFLWLFYLWSV